MTASEHLRLVARILDSQRGRVVTVPRDSLQAVLLRAELGDDLVRGAVECAEAAR